MRLTTHTGCRPAEPNVASPPAEVTLSTCIGCGAMTLPGSCPGGCAQERRLELVGAVELDELTALTERAEARAEALAAVVAALLAQPAPRDDGAQAAETARGALAANGTVEPRLRELATTPIEPEVGWWCPRCGGVDAPQPCLGVCIRTPVRWADARRARAMQARALAVVGRTGRLRGVLSLVAHTHPQPGQAARHWRALGRLASADLLATKETRTEVMR